MFKSSKTSIKYKIHLAILLVPILFAVNLSTGSNSSVLQSASAQTSGAVNTFSAEGYTGQILVLPPSIPQVPVSEDVPRASVGSIIGGNWSFAVSDGQLQDFNWNATAYTLTGQVNGTFSIGEVKNASAVGANSSDGSIQLDNNMTALKGIVNIDINNETRWTDVPIAFYLLNGNLASFIIDNSKTDGAFPLPLYGVVTSLT